MRTNIHENISNRVETVSRIEYVLKLPKPKELIKEIPLLEEHLKHKERIDEEVKLILEGKLKKFLIIIGPCSADNEKALDEYLRRLSLLQEKVKDKILFVPRVYTGKPRTTGLGYKGVLYQPDPKKESNISGGLRVMRNMHVNALNHGFSTADEMLNTQNYPYLADILSYVAVGARSVENQEHRLVSSGLDAPVGMKNPMSGDINVMFNAVIAAQAKHNFYYNLWDVKTSGNPYAHCILRGYVDLNGKNHPNYGFESLKNVSNKYAELKLLNPSIIVDTNHSNSGKKFELQSQIALDVLSSMKKDSLINNTVKGLMIESYLEDGAQSTDGEVFGKSITDPCIGWEKTESMIQKIYEKFKSL